MSMNEIKEALQAGLAPLADQMKTLGARLEAIEKKPATSHGAGIMGATETGKDAGRITEMKDAADGTGLHFARLVKAQAVARMKGLPTIEVAKAWGHDRVVKALSQSVAADGGELVPTEFQAELIELLRTRVVVRKAGARALQFKGSMTLPKQTGAGTAYWGEENAAITPSQQALGSVQLQEKKLTALTVQSNDLIRNASLSAEMFVRDDLLAVISLAEDLAFIRGTGTASAPKGIRYWADSSHVYAETVASEGSPTLAEVKREIAKARSKLKAASIPFTKPGWVMASRTEEALLSITDSLGNAIYEDQLSKGMLANFPVYVTEQVPTNLSGDGDESELYLVDFDQLVIGDAMDLQIEVIPNGTYEEGGVVKSGTSRDQTVIRAIKKVDFLMRHPKAAAIVTELSWGR